MLQFMVEVTNLGKEVRGVIERFLPIITEKVPEAKDLLDKLYMVLDEKLANIGIKDQKDAAKTTNKFIHCHEAILHASECVAKLDQTMNNM